MNSGKLVLAGIVSALLVSAAAIPSLAQQASSQQSAPPAAAQAPRGPMGFVMQMFDTNKDGQITRDEFEADKAKIFGEIDKNGDKKLSYDEVKAWAKDVMAKMPGPGEGPGMGPQGGPNAPQSANGDADGKAPPPPPGMDQAAKDQAGAGSGNGPKGGPDGMRRPHGDRPWMRDGDGRDGGRDGRQAGERRHGMHPMGHMERHGDPRQRLAEMFLRADANDDGFISQEEFNVMADRMFTRMDRNGDGVLDMKDMPHMHMMRHHGPKPMDGPGRGPDNGPDGDTDNG